MNHPRCTKFLALSACLLAASPILLIAQQPHVGGQAAGVASRRPYLGMRAVSANTPEAKQAGIESPFGVAVIRVVQGGPAAKAGLRRGDLIVEYAGREVQSYEDIAPLVQRSRIGSTQRLAFVRGNRRVQTHIVIGAQAGGAILPGNTGGIAPPQQPSPLPPPSGGSKPATAAMAAAFRFRGAAAADFDKAIAQYDATQLGFLTKYVSGDVRSLEWSAFMASSLVLVGHVDSAEPVVAYYNPLYDAILITRWAVRQDVPKIVAADLRLASAVASGSGELPPFAPWLNEMAKRPAPDVLKDHYVRVLKRFEKAFPPRATSIAQVALSANAEKIARLVESQAVDALHNLLAIQQQGNAAYNPRLHELQVALANRDAAALARLVPKTSATSAGVLSEMPSILAKTVVPCYALLGKKDAMVFLQNSLMPRYYMLVVFRHGATAAETEIRSVLFFELPQESL